MRRVYPDDRYCIGCRICRTACVLAHTPSRDIRLWHEEASGVPPLREVDTDGDICVSASCLHCEYPRCVESCLTGAMHRDPMRPDIVVHDADACIGCWMCVMSCPYGAIRRIVHDGQKSVTKCDMCAGLETPACVVACPNRALLLEERD